MAPAFIEYCKVESAGQGEAGAAKLPPFTVQVGLHVLLVTTTVSGATAREGQEEQPLTVYELV